MNILLINNHSLHLKKLARLTRQVSHHLTIVDGRADWSTLYHLASLADGIIISGGSNGHSVKYDPDYYAHQINLVRLTDKPVIGICLGAQIIAASFHGQIDVLPKRSKGLLPLAIQSDHAIFNGLRHIHAYQSHAFTVSKTGPHMLSLAKSKDGHEIIKHRQRPIYGLQFHPEVLSSRTTGAAAIFQNILRHHQ